MVMRVGGLASGMDIDALVEKLMMAEKAPLDKLYQNKQKYEWQRDSYRDVNKQLKAFDESIQKNVIYKKDMYQRTATSSNSAVSATPTSASNGQTLSIDSVNKLAKAGTGVGTIAANTAKTTTMAELGAVAAGSTTSISLNVLQNDGTMKAIDPIEITGEDTIESVIGKLKNKAGINAFYDEKSGQIALSSKATGKGESITYTIPDVTGSTPGREVTSNASVVLGDQASENFFSKLGFSGGKGLVTGGENAEVTINGATIERTSNTFEIDGFNVTLNHTTSNTGQPITLTAKTDVDNMVDKIKAFVETYNGLVESLSGLTKEQKYRDYAPLTDEQKKDMEEKEIELWEEKAKSGLLRGDSIIQGALSKMRSNMYSTGPVSNKDMDMLYKIGIDTSKEYKDNGKLVIDEDKLREAIEKDSDAVYELFSGTTDNPGIATKIRTTIKEVTADIEEKAGRSTMVNAQFGLGRTLEDVEDRISNWKRKLKDIEDRYWKQFTAMETAINKANQQSSMFMQQ